MRHDHTAIIRLRQPFKTHIHKAEVFATGQAFGTRAAPGYEYRLSILPFTAVSPGRHPGEAPEQPGVMALIGKAEPLGNELHSVPRVL